MYNNRTKINMQKPNAVHQSPFTQTPQKGNKCTRQIDKCKFIQLKCRRWLKSTGEPNGSHARAAHHSANF